MTFCQFPQLLADLPVHAVTIVAALARITTV